jgi:hypothetical protein
VIYLDRVLVKGDVHYIMISNVGMVQLTLMIKAMKMIVQDVPNMDKRDANILVQNGTLP